MSEVEKIIELIFGKRGSGKTFLAKKFLRKRDRLLVYDTIGEYTDGVVIKSLGELRLFWHKVYLHPFCIIYQPLDPEGEFDYVCKLVWALQDMTFAVEEIDRYARPLAMSLSFKEIVQRGRHRNISLVGITQRPHGVDKLITSQAKAMYIFNTTEPRDIQYFKDVIGELVAEKIAQLKQYEYVKWQDGKSELKIERE